MSLSLETINDKVKDHTKIWLCYSISWKINLKEYKDREK